MLQLVEVVDTPATSMSQNGSSGLVVRLQAAPLPEFTDIVWSITRLGNTLEVGDVVYTVLQQLTGYC